jgi:hypothetical protein
MSPRPSHEVRRPDHTTIRYTASGPAESLVHWDMDAALREVRQPVTLFAVRDIITQEAMDRYGDSVRIELVDLGSHHFRV